MKDVDITEIFKQLKKGNKSGYDNNTLLQQLIKQIEDRIEELAAIKEEETESNKIDPDHIYDLNDPRTYTDFKEMNQFKDIETGNSPDKPRRDLKEELDGDEDFWVM